MECFEIMAAGNNDVKAIKDVVFTTLGEFGLRPDETGKDSDLNNIEDSYFAKQGFFGVIKNDSGEIVGTFGLYRISGNSCELRKMYLKKNLRGMGLGKFMLDFAIRKARMLGCKEIMLETISPLKEAICLYKSYGFTEIIPGQINARVDKAFMLRISP